MKHLTLLVLFVLFVVGYIGPPVPGWVVARG